MAVFKVILTTFAILSISIEDQITSSEEEMDLVIDMLLKNEIGEYKNSVENAIEEESIANPVYSDGVWKCGKCEDAKESKLIYAETYNIEANVIEEGSIDIQVGLSMQKISCVIVVGDLSSVKRVSGNCAGEGATLSINGASAAQCDVKVYE